jgi:hypothetical protein
MKTKSKKQKCIEMWEWLRDNPDAGKWGYMLFLREQKRENEFANCWACREAATKVTENGNACEFCPVDFPHPDGYPDCMSEGSPYDTWSDSMGAESKKAASDMVELIERTWKE